MTCDVGATLDLCQLTSTHVLELREDTTNQLRDIQKNADAQAREQRESFARMTELIANLTSRLSATSLLPPTDPQITPATKTRTPTPCPQKLVNHCPLDPSTPVPLPVSRKTKGKQLKRPSTNYVPTSTQNLPLPIRTKVPNTKNTAHLTPGTHKTCRIQ